MRRSFSSVSNAQPERGRQSRPPQRKLRARSGCSLVITGTANVFMEQRALHWRSFRQRQLVQSLLQQREHTAACGRAKQQSPFTSGFQTPATKALAQVEQAETTAITHLRMRSVPEQVFDEISGVRSHFNGPVQ